MIRRAVHIGAFCLALATPLSGCVALLVGAAGGAAGAVYLMGKLTEEVPYGVPDVHDAARSALGDLDLVVSEDRADALSGRLESEFADKAHVWIALDTVGERRTKITIRVGLTGDEVRSRKILDAIRAHLAPAPASPPPSPAS